MFARGLIDSIRIPLPGRNPARLFGSTLSLVAPIRSGNLSQGN
jgi:hypothetical protein